MLNIQLLLELKYKIYKEFGKNQSKNTLKTLLLCDFWSFVQGVLIYVKIIAYKIWKN